MKVQRDSMQISSVAGFLKSATHGEVPRLKRAEGHIDSRHWSRVYHLRLPPRLARDMVNMSHLYYMYVWSSHIARVRINRVRLPILLVVS